MKIVLVGSTKKSSLGSCGQGRPSYGSPSEGGLLRPTKRQGQLRRWPQQKQNLLQNNNNNKLLQNASQKEHQL